MRRKPPQSVQDCSVCGAREGERCISRSGALTENHLKRDDGWEEKYDLLYRVTPYGGKFNIVARGE